MSLFGDQEDFSDGEGSVSSDAEFSPFVEEPVTPVKKRRISLAECFEMSAPRRSASASSSLRDEIEMEKRFSMGDLFATSEEQTSVVARTSHSRPVFDVFPVEEMATWHPNRLWTIVLQQVMESAKPVQRNRMTSKRSDWQRLLEGLQKDPSLDMSNNGSALRRLLAYDCFAKVFARYSGCTWRVAKASSARSSWKLASKSDKMKWYVLKEVLAGTPFFTTGEFSDRGQTVVEKKVVEQDQAADDVKVPKSKVFENVVGLMLTYNTCIGIKDPEIMTLVQEDLPLDEFIAKVAKQEIHINMFNRFWSFIEELGKKLKFETLGASMEASAKSEDRGRVHLHAYLGTSIKGGVSAMSGVVEANVDVLDLIFLGVKPHVRPTRPKRKHPKTIFDAVVNGQYYVVAKKISSIMRKATLWPIEEERSNGQDEPV